MTNCQAILVMLMLVTASRKFLSGPITPVFSLREGSQNVGGKIPAGAAGYVTYVDFIGDNERPVDFEFLDFGAGETVREISSGHFYSCGLLNSDTVKCWGGASNWSGQLGYLSGELDGTELSLADFPSVEFPGAPQSVFAGYSHTCILRGTFPNNDLLCFGKREWLGYQSLSYGGSSSLPMDAPQHPIGGSIADMSLGHASTCVLKKEDNVAEVYCWGENERGQLGYGHLEPVATTPESISILEQGPVDIGANPISIYTSEFVSCILTDDGNVKCWGWGSNGATGYGTGENLGDDEKPSSYGFVPVGLKVRKLAEGDGAGFCVITVENTLRCLGEQQLRATGLRSHRGHW